ncbi:MAG: tRNA (adenosine(37)-N6)-dimethylallyltransferase MiaA [Microthrixaceae bacterium]
MSTGPLLPTERVRRLAIVGPTAAGKSALALAVARVRSDVELVSVDSMQVYRGMDIGTAKPSASEQAGVPHHMIDLLDADQRCAVGWFQAHAARAVDSIEQRGSSVLYVGGTGLYHRAVVDGLEIPPEYPEIRSELEVELLDGTPVAELHGRLARLDPLAASRTGLNDRRIIRALEVTLGSGRPFSSFGPGMAHYGETATLTIGLHLDRDDIGRLVERRVDRMLAAGLVEEVRRLERSPGFGTTAAEALGYKQIRAHLRGELSLEAAREAIVTGTRRFAVRQERWFRRDPRIVWFPAKSPPSAAVLADTLRGP